MMKSLLVASSNSGKVKEIKEYLKNCNLDIIGLGSFPLLPEVKEDGLSFYENALKKARIRAEQTGKLTLADDSGLEVEYLNGKPGIYSARYAGPVAKDEDNNRKLLKVLKNLPLEKRQARFKCVIALVNPDNGKEVMVEGICNGLILINPRGENGFGYDPLFLVPEYGKTMAELPLQVKNRISHRAKALERIKEVIINSYY